MRAMANRSPDLHRELQSVFKGAKLPTNPAIAVEILRLADDPASTADQFADVIRADVALSARLLEMANSVLFGQRVPVTNIKRAVTLLGLRRIRMVALGFQLMAHLDRLGRCPFDLKSFWQQSVVRACLARELAAAIVPSFVEEAFVVGLLQDSGILLLVQILGDDYAELYGSGQLTPTSFYLAEKERFRYHHLEAIRALVEEWKLPKTIAGPMGEHHFPISLGEDASDVARLSAVSYFVGSLPLADDQTAAASESGLAEYANETMGLSNDDLIDRLARAGEAYRHVASLLPDLLPEELDVMELLDAANRHLCRAANEAEQRVEAIEADRDRIRREQSQLRSALGQYRDRAAHDPLTRLLNRGALMDATLACIRDACDRDLTVSVYFLDIDDFKIINDEFGHHVGDEALRILAGAVSETVINGGFAGRYGGEEFIIVIPALDEDDARHRGRMLLDKVRGTSLGGPCPPRSLTCSIGAVWGRPGTATSPADLFALTDELMYRAKVGGKDRCFFKSLEEDEVTVLTSSSELVETGIPGLPDDGGVVSSEDLQKLAEDLNSSEPARFATMRKRERHSLLASCEVKCFAAGSTDLRSYAGHVRNISMGGVGLVTTRPLIRGEPVEVVIQPHSEAGQVLYIGGLVAFCRHVRSGMYEVGIQLLLQAKEPIFTLGDSSAPGQQLDWVIEALRESHGLDEPLQESA